MQRVLADADVLQLIAAGLSREEAGHKHTHFALKISAVSSRRDATTRHVGNPYSPLL